MSPPPTGALRLAVGAGLFGPREASALTLEEALDDAQAGSTARR